MTCDSKEVRTEDGRKVHIVRDRERRDFVSLRYAVKLLDEGMCNPRDYVSDEDAEVFEDMLKDMGILPFYYDDLYWRARVIGRHSELCGLMKAVLDADLRHFRYRPMKVERYKGSKGKGSKQEYFSYLDLGDTGAWRRSLCCWYAENHGLAYEARFLSHAEKGSEFESHCQIFDGEKLIVNQESKMVRMMNPEELSAVTAGARTSRKIDMKNKQ